MLLPDQLTQPTRLLIGGGKDGTVYLLNRDMLGHYNSKSDNQIVQSITGELGAVTDGEQYFATPGYWQNLVYFVAVEDVVKTFWLYNGFLSLSPIENSSVPFPYPGASPTITANGNTNGIVWALATGPNVMQPPPAVLHAYDAANVSRELYNSNQLPRDQAGGGIKFSVPTVANGKVYIGTNTEVDVYGLLP
jgi:hypothetical protein